MRRGGKHGRGPWGGGGGGRHPLAVRGARARRLRPGRSSRDRRPRRGGPPPRSRSRPQGLPARDCPEDLAVSLDPNTHAFVLATAFFTSIMFAIAALLPVGLALHFLFFGS